MEKYQASFLVVLQKKRIAWHLVGCRVTFDKFQQTSRGQRFRLLWLADRVCLGRAGTWSCETRLWANGKDGNKALYPTQQNLLAPVLPEETR